MGAEGGETVVEHLSSYSGSVALSFLCDVTSLSIDQINFITCQLVALFLSYILRKWVKNPLTRLWYTLVCGLSICIFCFGMQTFHLIISAGLSYLIISTTKSRVMPWLVLVSSMGYLSFLHIKRQFYDHNGYSLDISGPLMVLTQKLTSLAFAIMDGIEEKKEHELSPLQKQRAVRKVPSILEFCSYIFQFQSMLAGPLVFYDDFHVFIQMEEDVPSPALEVFVKLIKSVFFAAIFLGVGPKLDTQHVRSEEFLENTSSIYKMGYIMIATTIERCKYYHAWILADAVCNMSGLGYDSAKETWDKVSNVHPFRLELSLNLKEILDNWNIGTMKWLRYVVYERSPAHLRTNLVYMVSAFWHGFYPGYYITFLTGALFTTSGRMVRKHIRPYFLKSKYTKAGYDLVTWFTSRIILAYTTFPFVVQDFNPSLVVYTRLYFFMHILGLLGIYASPFFRKRSSTIRREATQADRSTSTPELARVGNSLNIAADLLTTVQSTSETNSMNGSLGPFQSESNTFVDRLLEANGNEEAIRKECQVEKENPGSEEDWKTLVMNSYDSTGNSAKLKTG